MGAFAASPNSPYWNKVLRTRAEIEPKALVSESGQPYHFITSIDNDEKGIKAGVISEADTHNTARCIAGQTHRLSTASESAAFLAESATRANTYRVIEEKKKNTSILQLSPELASQLGMASANAAEVKKKGAN